MTCDATKSLATRSYLPGAPMWVRGNHLDDGGKPHWCYTCRVCGKHSMGSRYWRITFERALWHLQDVHAEVAEIAADVAKKVYDEAPP